MLILIVPAGTKHSYIRLRSSPGKRRKRETGWLEGSLLLPVSHAACTDGEPERLYARLSSDCLLLWHCAPFARILVASVAGPNVHFSRLALLDPARLVRSRTDGSGRNTGLHCPWWGRWRLAFCVLPLEYEDQMKNWGCRKGGMYHRRSSEYKRSWGCTEKETALAQ